MKNLIKNILFDFVLWCLIYLAIVQSNSYAESALDFIVVCISFLVILTFVNVSKDRLFEIAKKKDQNCRLHRTYSNISTFFEILIFASQGWYWLASLWVVVVFFAIWTRSIYDKKFGEPKFL